MVQREWPKTSEGQGRSGVQPKLVPAPVASPGIRNALRGAFACEQDMTAEFDRLLAKIH